jgi:hypothetical protein
MTRPVTCNCLSRLPFHCAVFPSYLPADMNILPAIYRMHLHCANRIFTASLPQLQLKVILSLL